MLYEAGSYALTDSDSRGHPARGLIALSFTGGCLATVISFAPVLWSRRVLVGGILAAGLVLGLLTFTARLGDFALPADKTARFLILAQFSVFVVAGVGLLWLPLADLWHARDAQSALLALWVGGTFIFCWIFNWTINGRSILPMAPAVSILIARRIGRYAKPSTHRVFSWGFLPLVPVGLLAVAVTWADTRWADTARAAAREIHKRYGGPGRRPLLHGSLGVSVLYGVVRVEAAGRHQDRYGAGRHSGSAGQQQQRAERRCRAVFRNCHAPVGCVSAVGHDAPCRRSRLLYAQLGTTSLCGRRRAAGTLSPGGLAFAVSVHSRDGDWSIFRREIAPIFKERALRFTIDSPLEDEVLHPPRSNLRRLR